MKAKDSIVFFIGCVIFLGVFCSASGQDSADKKMVIMLKSFYTSYITQTSKEPSRANLRIEESIKKKYCTAALLTKIDKETKSEDLDHDPFLNAQDSDIAWLKTLSIVKSPKKKNVFTASYMDNSSKNRVIIHLSVVMQKDGFKINSVW